MNLYMHERIPKFNFNNPADFRKLEQMAYDMVIEIDDFPPAAYRYFDKLRNLYARYKYDNLSIQSAEIEKKKLLSDYIKANEAYRNWCEVYKAYQENIRKAGTLMSEIEKSEDIIQIADKACQVIGLMTGDEHFAERQRKKHGSKRNTDRACPDKGALRSAQDDR